MRMQTSHNLKIQLDYDEAGKAVARWVFVPALDAAGKEAVEALLGRKIDSGAS